MKTILVDDELWSFDMFAAECEEIAEIEIVGKFDDSKEALAYAEEHRVDLAFLDIEMPEMSGIDLSDKLRELYPDIIVIFVSAYDRYMRPAMKEHDADWFLLKPYTGEEVRKAVERAKGLSVRQKKSVEIRTFGNFEVYVNGEALKFTSIRAKEILALLVDGNGDSMSTEAIYSDMYPGHDYNNQEAAKLRHAMQRLQKTLMDAGIENILRYFPHARALNCDMVECDYFDFLRGDKDAIKKYGGTYMFQFSWCERRLARLNTIKERYAPYAEKDLYGE